MVIILDGNLEIGAHARSNISYLICLRHLIRLREVTNRRGGDVRVLSLRKKTFLKLFLSYFMTKKAPFATKLAGGGGKALVAAPLKRDFLVCLCFK